MGIWDDNNEGIWNDGDATAFFSGGGIWSGGKGIWSGESSENRKKGSSGIWSGSHQASYHGGSGIWSQRSWGNKAGK